MMKRTRFLVVPFLIVLLAWVLMPACTTHAEESGSPPPAKGGDAAAEMARKLQNPLANMKALSTSNVVGFDTGNDGGTSYGVQLQPVYAIDFPNQGFTVIPRAVIPILGLEPGTDVRYVGKPTPPGARSVWGLGDSVFQTFISPHTDSKWKWGVGPQLSVRTRTDSDLGGPGWGAGVSAVIVGELAPNLSFSALLSNLWSFNGDYNVGVIQPMLFYNVPAISGAYIGYSAETTIFWDANPANTWLVPMGLTVGRTFALDNGNGLDLNVGPYYNVARPDGAARWQLGIGVTWIFP